MYEIWKKFYFFLWLFPYFASGFACCYIGKCKTCLSIWGQPLSWGPAAAFTALTGVLPYVSICIICHVSGGCCIPLVTVVLWASTTHHTCINTALASRSVNHISISVSIPFFSFLTNIAFNLVPKGPISSIKETFNWNAIHSDITKVWGNQNWLIFVTWMWKDRGTKVNHRACVPLLRETVPWEPLSYFHGWTNTC